MNPRAIWTFGAAMVLAGGAVMLTKSWLAGQIQPPAVVQKAPEVEMASVVVAAVPLRFGMPLERDKLSVIKWPADAVPEGVFSSLDQLVDKDGEQRVVLRAIEQNEPILPVKVSGFGGRASLSAVIESDKRATTIGVNDVNGVAGFVLPGDRVDVMLTREVEAELVTDILLQGLKVLAIDQDNNTDSELPSVAKAVTLEVFPGQAQKLALASQLGSLSLALRAEANTSRVKARTIGVADLQVTRSRRKDEDPLSVKIVRGLESKAYAVRPGQAIGTLADLR